MKHSSFVILFVMIALLDDVSSANGDYVKWRWRNDNGSVYTATWKDSVNTPVVLNQHETVRLRISLPLNKGTTSSISLRYSEDPTNSESWIPITSIDTGKFFIAPSAYLSDTLSYFDSQLLPVDSSGPGFPYRKTITLDSSSSHLLVAEESSLYELEFSLKPTPNIQPASAYFFWLFTNSVELDYWGLPEFPLLRTPPVNWSTHSVGLFGILKGVSFVDANTGTAVGYSYAGSEGKIFRTVDGGTTWVEQPSPTYRILTSVDFADANVGIAVGSAGTILRTSDGGQNWSLLPSVGSSIGLMSIRFCDANIGTIVGGDESGVGRIFRTTNGGESWSRQSCSTNRRLSAVCFTGPDVGTAVGEAGTILRTTNGGQNWFGQSSQLWGTNAYLSDVSFADANNGTIVGGYGSQGIILRTTDGGTTWWRLPDPASGLHAVCFTDESTGWAVGDRAFILKTTDGGVSWSRHVSGDYHNLTSVHFIDSKIGWAVGDGGIVVKTTNGGVTSVDHEETDAVPTGFALEQNYPNPFNPTTVIGFSISSPTGRDPVSRQRDGQLPVVSGVRLVVYNTLGQMVKELVNGEMNAGYHEVRFDGSNLASGVYFYRLSVAPSARRDLVPTLGRDGQAGEFVQTKRLLLLK